MKNDFKDTLLLAFENELIDLPMTGERWGFFNAQCLPANEIFSDQLQCEQGFRSEYLSLTQSGFETVPKFETNVQFDHCIVFSSRVRALNEQNFKRAWDATTTGGLVIVAGEKNTGAGSLRKWVSGHFCDVDSFSKYHAICFWCRKSQETKLEIPPFGKNKSGLFSADGPDKGSVLLTSFFDKRIKGKVADFGAGWGYLSEQLLERSSQVEHIDLYEADWHALEHARTRLEGVAPEKSGFHWSDIPGDFKRKPYEWVVMNPPFHHGLFGSRSADPQLGKAFIQTAASSLIQGGKLLMVANRNLPYEDTLSKAFRRVTKLADQEGYKVFEAVR